MFILSSAKAVPDIIRWVYVYKIIHVYKNALKPIKRFSAETEILLYYTYLSGGLLTNNLVNNARPDVIDCAVRRYDYAPEFWVFQIKISTREHAAADCQVFYIGQWMQLYNIAQRYCYNNGPRRWCI